MAGVKTALGKRPGSGPLGIGTKTRVKGSSRVVPGRARRPAGQKGAGVTRASAGARRTPDRKGSR